MTTVTILGAGSVGRALAERLVPAAYTVRFGARDPKATAAKLSGALADLPVLSSDEAAEGAEILLVAVPATASVDAVRSAGDVADKLLVDCTNPFTWHAGPVWAPPPEGSQAGALAVAFPRATVVKGFNHFGAEIQQNPTLASGPADAFFAGDDPDAKLRVMRLAAAMGFRPHDAGPLRNAALLENLAVLWIHLATAGGADRNFGCRMEAQR